jgi:hypothetical protein
MPSLIQLDYVLIALGLFLLAVAAYVVATGHSPLPATIRGRLRRVAASPGDERWQGTAAGLMAIAVLVNAARLGLTDTGNLGKQSSSLSLALCCCLWVASLRRS